MIHNLKKHLIYWIFPTIVVGICIWIYFFNPFSLSYIIAPDFNREFGVLENLQLVIIFLSISVSIKGIKQAVTVVGKIIFTFLLVGSIFILVEEMDYGLHFQNLLSGKSHEQIKIETYTEQPRNIHNQGNLTLYIKQITYLTFILFFIILPLVNTKTGFKNELLKKILPEYFMAYTILAMIFLNRAAIYIDKTFKDESISALNSNVSEFEEIFIYYIVLLYITTKVDFISGLSWIEIRNGFALDTGKSNDLKRRDKKR